MNRVTIQVGSYEVNCSILSVGSEAFVVDPGQEAERIIEIFDRNKLAPRAILLTHAHFDHISAIPSLQSAYPGLPVFIHTEDVPMFGHPMNQSYGEYESIGVPKDIRDTRDLPLILPGVEVLHTPGHTPGGVCYYFAADKLLLSGDTLFAGSIGRTDFPGGSMTKIIASLKSLMALPGDTLVVPGHGPTTTIATEKKTNPFIV